MKNDEVQRALTILLLLGEHPWRKLALVVPTILLCICIWGAGVGYVAYFTAGYISPDRAVYTGKLVGGTVGLATLIWVGVRTASLMRDIRNLFKAEKESKL